MCIIYLIYIYSYHIYVIYISKIYTHISYIYIFIIFSLQRQGPRLGQKQTPPEACRQAMQSWAKEH